MRNLKKKKRNKMVLSCLQYPGCCLRSLKWPWDLPQSGLSEHVVLLRYTAKLSKGGWVDLMKGVPWGESKGSQKLLSLSVTQIKEQKEKKGSYHWSVSANSYRAILLFVLFRIKKQLLSKSGLTLQALSYSVTYGASRPLEPVPSLLKHFEYLLIARRNLEFPPKI